MVSKRTGLDTPLRGVAWCQRQLKELWLDLDVFVLGCLAAASGSSMASLSLLFKFHQPCSARLWTRTLAHVRKYATHRNINPGPSLLSQSLDQNSKQDKGPFQLGLGLGQPAVQSGEKIPKWSELSTAGKGKPDLPHLVIRSSPAQLNAQLPAQPI
jgi:hypothetical protein